MGVRKASRVSQTSETEGLMVNDRRGDEYMVMASQEITDDVLATFPKLQNAVEEVKGKLRNRWKQHRPKNGVELYELVPNAGNDADVAHALLATAELKCHVNEVLSVLVHQDPEEMDATFQSIGGRKVRGGGIHYQQLHPLDSQLVHDVNTQPDAALFGVQTVVVRPKFSVKRHSKLRIGFSTCTIRFPKRDRAYHLMKTLPKRVHSRVVPESEGTALDGKHDHLAIGWDIKLADEGEYGCGNHTTRVIAHSYISTVPPVEFGRLHPASLNSSSLAQHRKAYSNADAERVIGVLTKSLREFETVIRRRRLGFQTFVNRPNEEDVDTPICLICRMKFSLFRHDHFCRLCGHIVCGECSGMYEVEAPIGHVYKKRYCVACIRRVDACHFEDEDLVPALGPIVVDTPEEDWESSVVSLTDSLLSDDPEENLKALESLDDLIHLDSLPTKEFEDELARGRTSSTTTSKISVGNPIRKKVTRGLEQRLHAHLKAAKDTYRAEDCAVYGKERDYAFEYKPEALSHPDIPLAPVIDAEKDTRRLSYMQTTGVLEEDYDRSALDLIAKMAAKRLGCPIGFVGAVGETHFHALGNYKLDLPSPLTRDENLCTHTIYAERPMILKNPQRDMRFVQLPSMRGGVQFYAGFPIRAPDGTVLGSLCAVDIKPHENIGTKEYATMEMLTGLAAELIVPKTKQK
ncbi:hypothetical protein Poli38472_013641 [Pythium oligandrum]|uniref:FYVE-type domain-containing protein n=1 Tax=Pythium oligandrum TaxID=41045 RepID=A0A8K1CEP1_PYTOL|nr:hypothetical protein Poli38472_013641 [Pythium oligandrum]|eukprot:TMW61178.1 hypothetical protein Poli38472_013641 [Pythium oligandrum]